MCLRASAWRLFANFLFFSFFLLLLLMGFFFQCFSFAFLSAQLITIRGEKINKWKKKSRGRQKEEKKLNGGNPISNYFFFLTKKKKEKRIKRRNKKVEKNHLDGWLTGKKKSSNTWPCLFLFPFSTCNSVNFWLFTVAIVTRQNDINY